MAEAKRQPRKFPKLPDDTRFAVHAESDHEVRVDILPAMTQSAARVADQHCRANRDAECNRKCNNEVAHHNALLRINRTRIELHGLQINAMSSKRLTGYVAVDAKERVSSKRMNTPLFESNLTAIHARFQVPRIVSSLRAGDS